MLVNAKHFLTDILLSSTGGNLMEQLIIQLVFIGLRILIMIQVGKGGRSFQKKFFLIICVM